MRGKGVFFETLGASKMGEKAQDIVIAMPNNENQTINLVIAKNLKTEQEGFTAEGMTIISSPGKSNGKVRLLLENIGVTQSSVQDFAHFVQKKVTNINNDHLDMSMLIIRLRDYQRNLRETTNREDQKEIKRHINQVYAEMLRRISTALSPLTFTLMGLSFGMNIGRKANAKRVFFAILLAAFYLIAFFAAKGLGNQLFLAAFFYLIPHLLIALLSMRYLRRISQGVT